MSRKIYHGWLVLVALFIIYSITNGVILNTLPLFYPELIKEFGWTQDKVTQPAQLLFLVVAIMSPFAGVFIDKFRIKNLMYMGAALILLAFVIFSKIQSHTALLLVYLIFSVGITLSGIIPSMKIITNWFLKNRGLAVGLLLVGSSIGGAIFNPVAGKFIADFGWRNGLLGLGLIAAVFIFAPLLFLVKASPAEATTDAGLEFVEIPTQRANFSGKPISYGDIFRSGVFYLLLFITGAMWFCIVGIIQHQALFIKDLNMDIDSAKVLSVFFLCSVLGKIIFGKLSDVYSKKHIMLLAVIHLTVGALILSYIKIHPTLLLWIYAVVFGIGFSGTFTMIQLLIAEYYQGGSYGKVLGVFTMVDTIAGVLGIMTLGKMRTLYGSYDSAFWVLVLLCTLALLSVITLPNKKLVA